MLLLKENFRILPEVKRDISGDIKEGNGSMNSIETFKEIESEVQKLLTEK